VTQLNEIEARKEEYPETIAFIRLLNSLITSALLKEGPVVTRPVGAAAVGQAAVPGLGAGGVPAAGAALDGGVELGLFTGFVVQHVLAHAWQRGYR
jgi:nuclear pore complex protein Nup205